MKNILIVEDNQKALNTAKKFFSGKRYNFIYAENFKEAVSILKKEKVDFVITDRSIPYSRERISQYANNDEIPYCYSDDSGKLVDKKGIERNFRDKQPHISNMEAYGLLINYISYLKGIPSFVNTNHGDIIMCFVCKYDEFTEASELAKKIFNGEMLTEKETGFLQRALFYCKNKDGDFWAHYSIQDNMKHAPKDSIKSWEFTYNFFERVNN